MQKPRTLKPNEIEVRVQSVQNDTANMLLYIDSRAATELLDETYGMENWSFEFKEVAGKVYGRLSVYDTETNRWIYREDTGSESNIEADKGLASDCYKRCLVRFGVTELYSSPKITWKDDGYKNTGYKVSEIEYDDKRNITHLVIVNRFDREAFRWDKGQKAKSTTNNTPNAPAKEYTKPTEEDIRNFATPKYKEFKDKGDLLRAEAVAAFARCYIAKLPTWKGEMDIPRLYNGWMNRN